MEEKWSHHVIQSARKSTIIPSGRSVGVATMILLGTSFMLFGCSLKDSTIAVQTDSSSTTIQGATDKPIVMSAPTPEPTQEPTPTPTATPVPELSLEEELRLLAIRNPDQEVSLATLFIGLYTATNQIDGENVEHTYATLMFLSIYMENDKKVWKFFDNNTEELMFTCYTEKDEDSPNDVFLFCKDVVSNLQGLQNLKLVFVTCINESNFSYIESNYGIKLNITDWVIEVSRLSDPQSFDYMNSNYEYAKHYIEIVPKELRAGSTTFKESAGSETPNAEPTLIQS